MNWEPIRDEFPALKRWTYLNTATFGQVPNRSKAALDRHFERRNESACADFLTWFDDMDAIRASVGRLVGCQAADIAFIPNASAGLSMLLGSMEWKAGDQILSLEGEFPNQLYYAGYLAAQGVELIVAPCGELLEHLTERTRLVAISTVVYSNGYTPPVQRIGEVLRERGILFFLDGTQSVGALRIDLAAVQPDMFAVNCYKWMLSPNGAGFMYVAPRMRAKLDPPVIGWRSDRDWRSVDALHQGAPRFPESAEKYEGGMLNFSALYAMADTIEMMLEIGTEVIEARVMELGQTVRDIFQATGAPVVHSGSPIVAAEFSDAPARGWEAEGARNHHRRAAWAVTCLPAFLQQRSGSRSLRTGATQDSMSYLDNLENSLKALEGREQSGPEDRRRRDLDRAAAIEAAPWAEKLKTGPWTAELMKQAARLGHERRTKIFIAWLGHSLKLEAKERKLELRPTASGIEALYKDPERQEPVDLDGSAEQFLRSWLDG